MKSMQATKQKHRWTAKNKDTPYNKTSRKTTPNTETRMKTKKPNTD